MRTARPLLALCVAVTIVALAGVWLRGQSVASAVEAPVLLAAGATHERELKRGETHRLRDRSPRRRVLPRAARASRRAGAGGHRGRR